MFRSFIYANTDKIYEYYSLIDESIKEKIVKGERKINVNGKLSAKMFALGGEKTNTYQTEFSQYFLSDYHHFETKLEELDGEKYFDLEQSFENYDIKSLPKASIGKLESSFYVPEGFDFVDLIHKFMPAIKPTLDIKEEEEGLYDAFLGDTKADIPIVFEFDNNLVTGKLDNRFLLEDYNQLEEYESDEVTVLFRLLSKKNGNNIVIYDPLKDFIKLNRTLRRSADFSKSGSDEFSPIKLDGSVIKIEVIAIYR